MEDQAQQSQLPKKVGRPVKIKGDGEDKSTSKTAKTTASTASVSVTGLTEVVGVELAFAPSEFVVDDKTGHAVVTLNIKQAKKLYAGLGEQLTAAIGG